MSRNAKILFGLVLAAALIAPQAAGTETLLKTSQPTQSGIDKFLPPLAPDVPWIPIRGKGPVKLPPVLPEAGSATALMLPAPLSQPSPILRLGAQSASASTAPSRM